MEISGVVFGGVDGDTTAGGGALRILVKGSYGSWSVESEVSGREGGKQEKLEESHLDSCFIDLTFEKDKVLDGYEWERRRLGYLLGILLGYHRSI